VTLPVTTQVPVVEAVFPLAGKTLPREHAQALKHALVERLPWLEEDAGAGIHPAEAGHRAGAVALLSQAHAPDSAGACATGWTN
jgi:hypothetical protein